jgi:hypothetical protein
MTLTFRHTFATGHRVILSFQGPDKRPRFAWPDGMPPLESIEAEYLPWIKESFQQAANACGGAILYLLPKGKEMTQMLFIPDGAGKEDAAHEYPDPI